MRNLITMTIPQFTINKSFQICPADSARFLTKVQEVGLSQIHWGHPNGELVQALRITIKNPDLFAPVGHVQFAARQIYTIKRRSLQCSPIKAAYEIFVIPRSTHDWIKRPHPMGPYSKNNYPFQPVDLPKTNTVPNLAYNIRGFQAVPIDHVFVPKTQPSCGCDRCDDDAPYIWLAHALFCGAYSPTSGKVPEAFQKACKNGLFGSEEEFVPMLTFFAKEISSWARTKPTQPRIGALLPAEKLRDHFAYVM